MGCHGRQASLGFTTSPLHHDQHLPDQPGCTAGASAPQQVQPGPLRSSTSIIRRPQQVPHQVFGRCGAAAFIPDGRRIHLSVPEKPDGKDL